MGPNRSENKEKRDEKDTKRDGFNVYAALRIPSMLGPILEKSDDSLSFLCHKRNVTGRPGQQT